MPLRNPFRGSKQRKKINRHRFIFERDIEPLEPRRLLTTIVGGESFEYQDINGNIDRVTATGNITAELIGASVDRASNNVTLVDLPGELFTGNGPPIALNGGVTAPQGVQVIGLTTISDPIDPNGSVNGTISALASETNGQLWGVNVVIPQTTTNGTPQNNLLQIVKIDSRNGSGVVVAEVSQQALAAAAVFSAFAGGTGPTPTPPQITGATAAAFNPSNGLLYFVATGGINNTPVLFTIDVHASDIGGSLRAIPGTFRSNGAAATNVGGMVFDQTGGGGVRLVAALNIGASTQLDTINLGNSDLWTEQVAVNTGGIPLVGLSLLGDNPNAEDTIFYGLTGQSGNGSNGGTPGVNGANSIAAANEVQITVFGNTSNTVDFGALNTQTINLVTGGQTQGTVESAPGDLTYDPTLFDPFTGTTGALVGTDLQTHDLFILSPVNRTPTTTMFAIYVSQSDASGGISAAVTPKPPASPIPMLPFSGSIGSIRIRNTTKEVNAPTNTGSILLGARTIQLQNNQTSSDVPILSGTLDRAHGVFPGGAGTQVEAGLVVAPGQVMGKFLWGGTIMGQVIIHGSIDQFYCGWLITGDSSSGLAQYANIGIDFLVDGDIRNLYVKGPIGTDSVYGLDQSSSILEFNPGGTTGSTSSGPPLDQPDYVTGFTMFVGGSLGSIRAGGSIIGNIRVAHTSTPSTPTWDLNLLQNEMENRATPTELDSLGGPGNAPFSGLSAFDDVLTGGDPIFNNDTFQTAEVLGALPTVSGGPNSQVVINGDLQAAPRQNDYADYYGVSLLAGQTVSVQLTNVGLEGISQSNGKPIDLLQVGVFDPNGRLIATDENDVLPSQTLNKPFRFTADTPGLYRFAVVEYGDASFVAAADTLGNFVYTLEIGNVGDIAVGGIVTSSSMLDQGLMVDHGDMGVVEVAGTLLSDTPQNMVVAFGNMRAVEAAGIGIGFESDPGNRGSATGTYGQPAAITSIQNGANTSTVQVSSTTKGVSVTFPTGLDLSVPNGMVGELNAFGSAAANLMLINDAYSSSTGLAPPVVGGDIQLVNCAGDFWGLLYTNGSIGTIRAGDMQGIDVFNEAPQFHVNVDGVGAPGIIDLIDVVGDMGDLALGGPGISTGPGGNVRYIRVGGTVYRDTFFGGRGTEENTTYGPGVSATIVDDSGALIHITPEGDVLNPNFVAGTIDPNNPAFEQFQPASLTMMTYPIEGSGGSVIVNLTSSGSLTITSNGDVPGQTAEIGRIEIQGAGTAIGNSTVITPQGTVGPLGSVKEPKTKTTVTQPAPPTAGGTTTGTTTGSTTTTSSGGSTGTGSGTTSGTGQGGTGSIFTSPPPTTAGPGSSPGLTETAGGLPLFIHVSGPANVDLFDIVVLSSGTFGTATEITNTSGGEIVNVLAKSIGRLFSTGSIGVAKQHTAAAVNPMQVIMAANNLTAANIEQYQVDPDVTAGHYFGNLYPFEEQRIGIVVMGGDLLSVEAPVIGNIMVNGTIGQVIADGNTPGQGIVAPVVAYDLSQPTILNRFQINTGPQPAGNIGSVQIGGGIAPSGSGMFAYSGIFADGRVGTISGNGADVRGNIVTAFGVDTISLHNGSIINADIDNTTIGQQYLVTEGVLGRAGLSVVTPIDTPQVDMGTISLTGNGGIIGLEMRVDHLGSLTVNGGFGIFNSFIFNSSDGSIGTIRADGYGIRNTSILGGIVIGSITATQNGQQIPTSNYSPDVRTSETASVDPYFGFAPNFLTDIDVYLGTNASQTTSNETQGGVIENLTVAVSRDLGSIRAFSYQQNALGTLLTTQLSDPSFFATSQGFVMALNIGNTIGTLTSVGGVNGMSVITGKVNKIQFGSDVSRLDMELAGRISKLTINGNLDDGSTIFAKGINGNIGTITVRGNLDGTIKAQKKIGNLMVGGNLTGTVDAANITKIQAGSLNTGNLTIDGNLQNLISLGDLGTTGQSILVHGSVGKIQVAGNMNTSANIQGNLKMLKVGGSITSGTNIVVTNTLTAMLVNGDVQTNATVKAHLIKSKKIKGQTLGSVISGA